MAACGEGNNGNNGGSTGTSHEHKYTLEHDAGYHWYECKLDGCTERIKDRDLHSFGEWETTKEANDEEDGLEKRECSVCHYVQESVIPKHEHRLFSREEFPATCTEEGNIAYWRCQDCDKYFSDKECKHEIAKEDTVIPRIPHDFTKEDASFRYLKSKADCTHKAVYYKSCSVCGECASDGKDTFEYGEFSEHIYGTIWEKDGAQHWHACTVCGDRKEVAAHDYTYGNCECGEVKPATDGLQYAVNEDGATASCVGLGTASGTVVIAAEYEGKPVTKIAEGAFVNGTVIESLYIPESVTEIAEGALNGCSALKSLTLPYVHFTEQKEDGEYIYPLGYLFGNKSYLGGITIKQTYGIKNGGITSYHDDKEYVVPASLESLTVTVGGQIQVGFDHFASLKSIALSNRISQIWNTVFEGCTGLTSLTAESGGTYSCKGNCLIYTYYKSVVVGIKTSVIPADDSVTEIGSNAFRNCIGLQEIDIPANIQEIGDHAFEDCFALRNVTLRDGLTKIGGMAFYGCTSLTEISLPASVSEIAWETFAKCTALSSVTVGGNELSIESGAFLGCTALTDVTLSNGVTSIENKAFEGCVSLAKIEFPSSVASIGQNAFHDCTALSVVVFSNGLTSIGEEAFFGCTSLAEITIPETVTSIGKSAFANTALRKITVESGNSVYHSEGNCLIETNSKTLICGSDTSVIPTDGSVVTIASNAFDRLFRLTSVTVPACVTKVESYAFSGMPALTVYCEAESKPSGWAEDWTYLYSVVWNCNANDIAADNKIYVTIDGLRYALGTDNESENTATVVGQPSDIAANVVIPDSVTYNGKTYPVTMIDSSAFMYCEHITSVVIGNNVGNIHSNYFSSCKDLASIAVAKNNLYYYGEGNCIIERSRKKLVAACRTSVIPDGVKIIGNSAFEGLRDLTGLTIPESVVQIESYAFRNCDNLITIEDGICYVGNWAIGTSEDFCGETLSLRAGTAGIADNAFYGSNTITRLTIPQSVKHIGKYAFGGCAELTFVTIESGAKTMGQDVFYGCDKLQTFDYLGTLTDWCRSTGFSALTQERGGNVKLLFNGEELAGELAIPNGVEELHDYVFYGFDKITSVVVPDSVSKIGYAAFGGCGKMTSITLPFVGEKAQRETLDSASHFLFGYIFGESAYEGGVETEQTYEESYDRKTCTYYLPQGINTVTVNGGTLHSGAFSGCATLDTVTVGKGVTVFEDRIFYNCTELETVNWNAVSCERQSWRYSEETFMGCDRLTTVTFGDEVTEIPADLFINCNHVTSVAIPDSVTRIGQRFFADCDELTNVTIGNGLSYLDAGAFSGCTKLQYNEYAGAKYLGNEDNPYIILCQSGTATEIHENTKLIAAYAFRSRGDITQITIPDRVVFIGLYAFDSCWALNRVTFGEGLLQTNSAFYSCSALTRIEFGPNIPVFERDFTDCDALNQIVFRGDLAAWCEAETLSWLAPEMQITVDGTVLTGAIVIPDSVTKIGAGIFASRKDITSVVIGSGVTEIGNYAFAYSGITSVTMGENVKEIGEYAFAQTKISNITLGNSVTSLGRHAFYQCTDLQSVTLGNGLTEIQDYTFCLCANLSRITFGENVQSIGDSAFTGIALDELRIPDSVTLIGDNAFSEAKLEYITIGKGVTQIGSGAFNSCGKLISVEVERGNERYQSKNYCVIDIEQKTLILGCKNSAIPADGSVTKIAEYAFYGCTGLPSVTIPDSVTEIGRYAFYGCTTLTEIEIPNSVEHLGYDVFAKCTSLQRATLSDRLTTVPASLFEECSALQSIVIPEGVTKIESGAFWKCFALESVSIPATVTEIERDAFRNCTSLKEIVLPEPLTVLAQGVFNGCTSLERIDIPEGITKINEDLFRECTSLKEITLPEGITRIDNSAFYGCSKLTNIRIPIGVTQIGSYAFSGISSYCVIACEAESKPVGWSAYWCSSDTRIVWNCNGNDKDQNGYAYTVADGIRYALKEGEATVIGRTKGAVSITIPESVVYGGNNYNVTAIGERAFTECATLRSITIGNLVASIGQQAFMDCLALENVTFGNGLKTIGDGAFVRCSALTAIAIPHGVTEIGRDNFAFCENLTTAVLPRSVTKIGVYAFYACPKLEAICYAGTAEEWGSVEHAFEQQELAKICYFSENEPQVNADGTDYNGNYWHYAADGVTPEKWVYSA